MTAITTPNPTVDPNQPAEIEKPPGLFLRFANWVSEAMGRPTNIAFWFVLVVLWTLIFALGGHHLASGTWLPAWFRSTGYNFPLNLVTTVATPRKKIGLLLPQRFSVTLVTFTYVWNPSG